MAASHPPGRRPDMKSTLLELADRCEREEASRRLDAEIGVAIRDRPVGKMNDWIDKNFPVWRPHHTEGRIEVVHDDGKGGVHWEVLSYTTSLDAAVTLVPEDWTAWELRSSRAKTRFHAELSRLDNNTELQEYADGRAKTPALALCAAALRALASKP